jgi:hypothetical protein
MKFYGMWKRQLVRLLVKREETCEILIASVWLENE